jgi:hypothetical protein
MYRERYPKEDVEGTSMENSVESMHLLRRKI